MPYISLKMYSLKCSSGWLLRYSSQLSINGSRGELTLPALVPLEKESVETPYRASHSCICMALVKEWVVCNVVCIILWM